ncbi:MAG: hypothetical protein JWO52_7087, partial [Gammaproteobacteria bacterium]|nr:hypothetical protein [Gammaproteobacteria bacterium]
MATPADPGTATDVAASMEARMYRSVAAAWESIRTALADCMPGPHFLATRQRYRRIPYDVKYFATQSRWWPAVGSCQRVRKRRCSLLCRARAKNIRAGRTEQITTTFLRIRVIQRALGCCQPASSGAIRVRHDRTLEPVKIPGCAARTSSPRRPLMTLLTIFAADWEQLGSNFVAGSR